MRRFAITVAAILALSLPSGCGGEADEPPVSEPLEPATAPAVSPEADSGPTPEAETKREAAGSDASPITTQEELRAALVKRNPGFDGEVYAQGDGQTIAVVGLGDSAIEDLSPLAGLPLERLELMGCRVRDLSPLAGMPLRVLGLEQTEVRDIGPLKGMPLSVLSLSHTQVDDISALAGSPLEELYLVRTKVTDLGPLAGMRQLRSLWLNDSPVSDVAPLQTVPLVSLTLAGTKVSDLSSLKGLPITRLHIARSEVTDLAPLEWLQLERFVFTPGNIQAGIEHVRNMRSLRQIGTSFGEESEGRESDVVPPGEFWELYDAGKFK
ncbi:MAG: leucine-rich repeat domain-containing protein [Planctomycetota bacterium]